MANESSVVNPAPTPMQNSFSGMVVAFPNVGIHTLVASTLKFRKQLTVRPELKQQSGWNNELNVFMAKGLESLAKHCKRIVYNSASTEATDVLNHGDGFEPATTQHKVGPIGGEAKNQTQIERDAANVMNSLKEAFSANAPDIDNLLPPPNGNRMVAAQLDGTDLNYPQLDGINAPNDHLRAFVLGLDNFAVQATRLDSRNDSNSISKYENGILHGLLSQLWTMLEVFGGENNRVDTPAGTLPDDEPNTLFGGAQIVTPASTKPSAS
jgi:hypothetical protein